jgi:hypothetical protein
VLSYLKGTLDCGLSYNGDHDFRLSGYADSDWGESVSGRKSTSGCCFSLGLAMIFDGIWVPREVVPMCL